ncbi:MAG: glutamine synthetase beta-grasp domain-containing protein, partial [Zestosphaera sp.]
MESIMKAIELLKTNNVRWVHVLFTDIRGLIHDIVVPAREFVEGNAFTAGLGFDGSSVRGYKTIEESDMILVPDPNTLVMIPWSVDEDQKSAVVIGDVHEAYGGGASEACPRSYVARRAAETAQGMGYTGYFAPELEYFLFSSIDLPKLVWNIQAGSEVTPGSTVLKYREAYCRPPPEDTTVKYRNEVSSILEDYFGFEIEKHHHEVAASQIEIDFAFGPLVETADKVMYFKFVAKNIAKKYGLTATFMPKPIYFDNASGMHTHISLWRGEKNEMYDENDGYAELSQIGRYFIGGLLEHARALTAICCPTVNSYKRLVPGFEAPIYITWSRRNRSALIRIP